MVNENLEGIDLRLTNRWFSEQVHLRDGPMMGLVTPTIRDGGVNCVYVVRRLQGRLLEACLLELPLFPRGIV